MKLTKEKTLIGTFLWHLHVANRHYTVTEMYQINVTWVGRLLGDGSQCVDYVEADSVSSLEESSIDGLGPHFTDVQFSPMQEARAIQIFNERRAKESDFDRRVKQRAAEALRLQIQEIESRRAAALGASRVQSGFELVTA